MLKALVLSAAIIMSGCGSVSQTFDLTAPVSINSDRLADNERKSVNTCNFDLKEKLKFFYSTIPDNFRDVEADSKFLEELKACPREETINSIAALQKTLKKDEEIQAKSAYLLVKLNHNKESSQKILSSVFRAYQDKTAGRFRRDHIIDMIGDVLINDDSDKKFLAEAFDLSLEVDGASAEAFSGILANEFEKNPESFLRSLKAESKKVRQQVYSFLFYSLPKDVFIKHLSTISESSDVYPLRREMLEFAQNNNSF